MGEIALVTITEYLSRWTSEKSRPNRRTVAKHLKEGKLPGVRHNSRWYVDLSKCEGVSNAVSGD